MAREKIGELFGQIDVVVDDDLPDDMLVLHNDKEAVGLKNGQFTKLELKEAWARESRLAGKGRL